MSRLSLSFLGVFQARLDGQPIHRFESNKVRALLAYLAVEADRPHSRERLAALLWPEKPNSTALANLRFALSDLRQAIGDRQASPTLLLISHETIQLNRESEVWVDVEEFERLSAISSQLSAVSLNQSAISNLKSAIDLYCGPFLEGFTAGDSAAFEEWALLKREQLQRTMVAALQRLAEFYELRGEYAQALPYARRQVELEPWQEEAYRQVMRLLAFSELRSAALAQYEACRLALQEELGVGPAPETTALYESIREGKLTAPPTPPAFLRKEGEEIPWPVFVARQAELAWLDGALRQALAGQGKAVFVAGDPGCGKTALVQEFSQRAMQQHPDLVVASGRGNAYTGLGDPYFPFIEILQALSGEAEASWAGGEISREHALRLWRLLPETARALVEAGPDLIERFVPGARLLHRAQAFAPGGAGWLRDLERLVQRKAAEPPGQAGVQQADLFEQYTQVLQALARKGPLLLALDDLQWADAGSLHLLFHLGRKLPGSRILVVGAYRSSEVAQGRDGQRHPLEPVVNEFQAAWGEVLLDLNQVEGRAFVDAWLDHEPNRLEESFRQTLFRLTAGHPLFTVELTRGLQERGDLVKDDQGCWVAGSALDWERLPRRVEAAIREHIARLPHDWQRRLLTASVEGEEFTAEALAQVQGESQVDILGWLSGDLARRHQLVRAVSFQRLGDQPVSRFRFRHYLFQKYLYGQLDPVESAHLHQAIGEALESLHGQETGDLAVQLARHFELAGLNGKAVGYLQQAGERAVRLSANEEALTHFRHGLGLLQELPDPVSEAQRIERDRAELKLLISQVQPLTALQGFASDELKSTCDRARQLCLQVGNPPELFPALAALKALYDIRLELEISSGLAKQMLAFVEHLFAEQQYDSMMHIYARFNLANFYPGQLNQSREAFTETISLYDFPTHHTMIDHYPLDVKVSALGHLSWLLLFQGYPDQASECSRQALEYAEHLGNPHMLAMAQALVCVYYSNRRDFETALKYAQAGMALCGQHKIIFFLLACTELCGETLCSLGKPEGISLILPVLHQCRKIGAEFLYANTLISLAEACLSISDTEQGLEAAQEGLAIFRQHKYGLWEARMLDIQGKLLLKSGAPGCEEQAEASFRQAIALAQEQEAKWWELRAAASLARMWQKQGKPDEARRLLEPVYAWFSEGFDTPDLKDAQSLLESLAEA